MGKNIIFFSVCLICCSICPQNTSLILVNETMASNSMRLNPHIQYYSTVYIVSMGAAFLLKTMRGLVFVKVRHPTSIFLWVYLTSVTYFVHLYHCSVVFVLLVNCFFLSAIHALMVQVLNSKPCGPNPFICPLPCLTALHRQCVCLCVFEWGEERWMCVHACVLAPLWVCVLFFKLTFPDTALQRLGPHVNVCHMKLLIFQKRLIFFYP